MIPKYLKVLQEENSSIQVRYDVCSNYETPWHFHPELELNLVIRSTGTRFVGDSIGNFEANDLVLLGANIPHYWKNDIQYYQRNSSLKAEAVIVRFKEDFLSSEQHDIPEMANARKFFVQARRGLQIKGSGKKKIIKSMKRMMHCQGLERLILFLEIVHTLTSSCDYNHLSSEGFMTSLNSKNEKRMNDVCNFITHNFQDKISLYEIANQANMNPSAFSRYFVQCSGKSVTSFIHEIRLGHACKLLIQTEKNISEILYESGFQSQANFNKIFTQKMDLTPSEYRQKHQ